MVVKQGDRVVAEFDGYVYLMMASPRTDSFLVTIRNEGEEGRRGRYRDLVVDLDRGLSGERTRRLHRATQILATLIRRWRSLALHDVGVAALGLAV